MKPGRCIHPETHTVAIVRYSERLRHKLSSCWWFCHSDMNSYLIRYSTTRPVRLRPYYRGILLETLLTLFFAYITDQFVLQYPVCGTLRRKVQCSNEPPAPPLKCRMRVISVCGVLMSCIRSTAFEPVTTCLSRSNTTSSCICVAG